MFKLLEQLQLFDSDTISFKRVWMDIKIMLRKAIEDFQSPLRQRARHTDLLYVNEIADKHAPMSLLEDMIDTLIRTAQEEDFERGNSSKNGRADDSDDGDRENSSKKKNRRHKKTRRERTELAQVASTTNDSNDKKGVREADNKMIKKLNEMKGITCSNSHFVYLVTTASNAGRDEGSAGIGGGSLAAVQQSTEQHGYRPVSASNQSDGQGRQRAISLPKGLRSGLHELPTCRQARHHREYTASCACLRSRIFGTLRRE
jgi:hypothetical protein